MNIGKKSLKYNPTYKKFYYLHKSMMNRCYLESSGGYHNYGAKGVRVEESWHNFDDFMETIEEVDGFDLQGILSGELQLDKDIKIKGNKIYSKDNCKFVTRSENTGNRPSNTCDFIAVDVNGVITRQTNRENFCREHNLDSSTVWRMLNRNNLSESRKKQGICTFYKGWQFFYPEEFDESMIKHKRIIQATNVVTNEKIDFHSPAEFAKEHNLNANLISAVMYGRQKKTGDWKFEIIKEGERR